MGINGPHLSPRHHKTIFDSDRISEANDHGGAEFCGGLSESFMKSNKTTLTSLSHRIQEVCWVKMLVFPLVRLTLVSIANAFSHCSENPWGTSCVDSPPCEEAPWQIVHDLEDFIQYISIQSVSPKISYNLFCTLNFCE